MKRIAEILSTEEWPLLDLTLRQFKLPTQETWSSDKNGYVVSMIDAAEDDKLIELGTHLGIESSTPRPSNIDPEFWAKDHLRLFVSHLAKFKKSASALQVELSGYQISGFIAHKDIEPTKKWQDEIELALSTGDALIALLHPGFHASKWTDQEIGFALGRGLPILAVRIGEDPYGFLAREQAIQGIGIDESKLARQIFNVFVKNKQTAKRMAESLVKRFVASESFQAAKSNFALMEKIEYWDSSLDENVRSALKKNDQISDAWGVPEKIKAFLKQMNSR